tara:strand:- start:372 stop:500 length:129 start_codon:yes stop_codon:yes gene_type:complete
MWCGREIKLQQGMHSIYASWEVNPPMHQREGVPGSSLSHTYK